jgi:hypothetical protein
MQESNGGEILPFMFRASSSRNPVGVTRQCTATYLEPLPPPVAKDCDNVLVTRRSKVTAVNRETSDDA